MGITRSQRHPSDLSPATHTSTTMPLNLLKHKSYHVSRAENLERVRKDEAAAAKKLQEDRQVQRANQIAELRQRKGIEAGSRQTREIEKTGDAFGAFRSLEDGKLAESAKSKPADKRDARPYEQSRVLEYTSGSVMSSLYAQSSGDRSRTRSSTRKGGRVSKSQHDRGPPMSARKKDDARVKSDMDPLAAILKGVEMTRRFEHETASKGAR